MARPNAGYVIARTTPRRKPNAIHFQRTHDRALRAVHRDVPYERPTTIREIIESCLEVVYVFDLLTVELDDNRTARNSRLGQEITWIRDVHTLGCPVVVASLLIRQVIDSAIAELKVFARGNCVKIGHQDRLYNAAAAALYLYL